MTARLSPRLLLTTSAQSGFTLIELLIVLVILGMLGGLIGPRLLDRLDRSKVSTAETQVRMLKSALDTMRLDLGRYPTTEEGLDLLVKAPADPAVKARWQGPYLEGGVVPPDPWTVPYKYELTRNPVQPVAIYSLGQDGKPGGEGLDADVGLLPPK